MTDLNIVQLAKVGKMGEAFAAEIIELAGSLELLALYENGQELLDELVETELSIVKANAAVNWAKKQVKLLEKQNPASDASSTPSTGTVALEAALRNRSLMAQLETLPGVEAMELIYGGTGAAEAFKLASEYKPGEKSSNAYRVLSAFQHNEGGKKLPVIIQGSGGYNVEAQAKFISAQLVSGKWTGGKKWEFGTFEIYDVGFVGSGVAKEVLYEDPFQPGHPLIDGQFSSFNRTPVRDPEGKPLLSLALQNVIKLALIKKKLNLASAGFGISMMLSASPDWQAVAGPLNFDQPTRAQLQAWHDKNEWPNMELQDFHKDEDADADDAIDLLPQTSDNPLGLPPGLSLGSDTPTDAFFAAVAALTLWQEAYPRDMFEFRLTDSVTKWVGSNEGIIIFSDLPVMQNTKKFRVEDMSDSRRSPAARYQMPELDSMAMCRRLQVAIRSALCLDD